ncbi:MAG: hypothetical protein V1789_10875, partial [PVC group bacterium]
ARSVATKQSQLYAQQEIASRHALLAASANARNDRNPCCKYYNGRINKILLQYCFNAYTFLFFL